MGGVDGVGLGIRGHQMGHSLCRVEPPSRADAAVEDGQGRGVQRRRPEGIQEGDKARVALPVDMGQSTTVSGTSRQALASKK